MVDLKGVKDRLLKHFEEVTEAIDKAGMPTSVETLQLTTSEIKDKGAISSKFAQLPKDGSHIYWIEVDQPLELVKRFSERAKATDYKCARDNKNANSKYVYVGSCTKTKLGDRLKQHCGWGNLNTYSLQLSKWIGDSQLNFTFYYVDMKSDLIVQYIEDQLHRELKPLLGKPGGNNKLNAVKI